MTSFTPYTAAEYAPDAPATADHFRRWFENWIAGFEGAPGAPRLEIPALGDLSAGQTIRANTVSEYTSPVGPNWFEFAHFQFLQGGSIRLAFEFAAVSSFAEARVRRRDGAGVISTLQTWSSSSATYAAVSLDFAVERGGAFWLEVRGTNSVQNAKCRNAQIKTGGEWLWPGISSAGFILK